MKYTQILLTLILTVILFPPKYLFCQEVSLGLKGGTTAYFGDIKNPKLTPYAGLSFDLWFAEKFSVGLLGYNSFIQGKEDDYYFETKIYWLAGILKYRPLAKNVVSPFIMAGLEGYTFNPIDKRGNPLPNNETNSYNKNGLGIPLGAGVSYFVNDNISIDLEGVYHLLFSDNLDDVTEGSGKDSYLSTYLGVAFHFGKPKDTDGDGIIDKQDLDPLRPEDFDGFRDTDGAPDLDNDQDDVPDVRDKAPMIPEDKDGFEDMDGVPDPDNDEDGILDTEDDAPNDPEDVDNFQDGDGAPDPDNDNDGIADVKDECPGTDETVSAGIATEETFNNYEDDDGCPDKKPEIAVEKGEAVVLEGVYFATGKADLTQNSRFILDKVVRTLRENPKIEVEIRGYTDNTGGYQLNMRLSKQRADAVKIYLLNQGIDAVKIRTRGFGPENPIATNHTREGRAKNRRIEFYRIK